MRPFAIAAFAIPVAVAVAGCQPHSQVVSKPGQITLENAMMSVGAGLRLMSEAAHVHDGDGRAFGVMADQVTITFNVTASQADTLTKQLVLDLEASAPISVATAKAGVHAGVTDTDVLATARGNTIVVRLANPAFAPKDTLISMCTTKPAAFKELVEAAKEEFKMSALRQGSTARETADWQRDPIAGHP